MIDLLLVTPPFTQLNTPYPATAYLKGFLNTKGITSYQIDLGIEVILKIFTKEYLGTIFAQASDEKTIDTPNAQLIYQQRGEYLRTIGDVISYLQGSNQTLARQICTANFLPKASRFDQTGDLEWSFGVMGLQDKAKHLATLYLEDISDFIVECVDANFGFSRYAERLGRSANSFDELYDALQRVDENLDFFSINNIGIRLLNEKIKLKNPKLICFSVPFPGNLYSAFACAQFIKSNYPKIKVAMGGGFANTELRDLKDPRVFDFFDFITLDDGELPIELLASNVINPSKDNADFKLYKRTFLREHGKVVYNNYALRKDYNQHDIGTPDYTDLKLSNYICVIQIANPMHSLWSDGRWLKLTMAHGCYWGKCTFCDVSLDYIKNYQPITAALLVDRMVEMYKKTGEKGFHFVDEAAPPSLMKAVALELLRRDLCFTWWTNIRFEKSFTKDLCLLLKKSGCVAVSGGLEVASDRLLALIDKGVTVKQVSRVTDNFTQAGILVHAYLMYGYPTQTVQETIDSLEMVRQMFELEIIQSGFWHQFALTAHSPIGINPSKYGLTTIDKEINFANNDVIFEDVTRIDHSLFSNGLKKSLLNYMHGLCFDFDLQDWFGFEIPKTSVEVDYIAQCLEVKTYKGDKPSAQILWINSQPIIKNINEKGFIALKFVHNTASIEIDYEEKMALWLVKTLKKASYTKKQKVYLSNLKEDFDTFFPNNAFSDFWDSPFIEDLKELGLLSL